MIKLLPYVEGNLKGTYDTSTKKLPRVTTAPRTIDKGRFYKASEDAYMIDFQLSDLEGYKIKHSVSSGDTSINIENVLVPVLDKSNTPGSKTELNVYAVDNSNNTTKYWEYISGVNDADETGKKTLTSTSSGSFTDQAISFKASPGQFWTFFADGNTFEPGFYWICLPGAGGKSFKFWYDENLWREKLEGTRRDIYFDGAGCVWYTEEDRDFYIDRKFISGPDGKAFGKNIKSVFFTSENGYNPEGFVNPFLNDGASSLRNKLYINDASHFIASGLGNEQNEGDFSSVSLQDLDFTSNIYFKLNNTGSSSNITFNNMDKGLKEIVLKYKDASGNEVEGTKIDFYNNRDTLRDLLNDDVLVSEKDIYIDQIGALWDGNPELDGTCIVAPYEFIKVKQDEFFILK